jgi:hypothetical protein
MEELYSFVFWHNHFEKVWYAIPRDGYVEFFNGKNDKSKVMKSKSIDTLVELLCKKSINIEDIPQDIEE